MDHSFEEIRSAALDLLAGRERGSYDLTQYQHLLIGIGEVFARREGRSQDRNYQGGGTFGPSLTSNDRERFLEVFWTLFREGVVTLGLNDSNREFPFFHLTEFGRRIIAHQQAYFFHDVSIYEALVRSEIPAIDETTLLYLKESMQSFRAGCILAATVMLGVATEHTFLLLIEKIEQNPTHSATFVNVGNERTILQKANKFKNILDQQYRSLPPDVRDDLDTHFAGILSIIRTFRNQSGIPPAKLSTASRRTSFYNCSSLIAKRCISSWRISARGTDENSCAASSHQPLVCSMRASSGAITAELSISFALRANLRAVRVRRPHYVTLSCLRYQRAVAPEITRLRGHGRPPFFSYSPKLFSIGIGV